MLGICCYLAPITLTFLKVLKSLTVYLFSEKGELGDVVAVHILSTLR